MNGPIGYNPLEPKQTYVIDDRDSTAHFLPD